MFLFLQGNITIKNAEDILNHLKNRSEHIPSVTPYQINMIVNISEQVLPFVQYMDEGEKMFLTVIDMLLNESRSDLEESQRLYSTSQRYVFCFIE